MQCYCNFHEHLWIQVEELRVLQEKTPKELWREDLRRFMDELVVSAWPLILGDKVRTS